MVVLIKREKYISYGLDFTIMSEYFDGVQLIFEIDYSDLCEGFSRFPTSGLYAFSIFRIYQHFIPFLNLLVCFVFFNQN